MMPVPAVLPVVIIDCTPFRDLLGNGLVLNNIYIDA